MVAPMAMLRMNTNIVAKKPKTGPAIPMSNSWFLFTGIPLSEMTAPKVPRPPRDGGGPGMKYGNVASRP